MYFLRAHNSANSSVAANCPDGWRQRCTVRTASSVPPLWLTHALGKPREWLTVGALSLATSGLPQGTSDGLCTGPAHKPPANIPRPNGYKARAGWAALGHRCPTLSHRAWLAVSHHLHDPTQASNPQHVQTRLHRHPIYVLASRMTNTDVCISQGVHIVVACVHCTKGESNRTTTMLSCTLCICPHPQQAPACYTQVIDMCVATKAVHMRALCA